MHIIALKTLRTIWEQYPDAQQALQAWYRDAKRVTWRTLADVKNVYRNTSFVGNNRVVFNIMGNRYHLVVAAQYQYGIIYIRFVGSHQDYNQIDVTTVQRRARMVECQPIRTEADYQEALTAVERLFDARPGTPEGDRLDVLATLVEAYEGQYYTQK